MSASELDGPARAREARRAAAGGDIDALAKVLDYKSLHGRDAWGCTLLYIAAEKGHEAVVALLLDKGAQVDAREDKYGRTPLHIAAWAGHEAVVTLLLDKGAQVEAKDDDGRTPLYKAAGTGHEAVVALLLDKGAQVEAVNKLGCTPLYVAAWNGHEAVVALLLDKGAYVEAANKNGETPLCMAVFKHHTDTALRLVRAGASLDIQAWGLPLRALIARQGMGDAVQKEVEALHRAHQQRMAPDRRAALWGLLAREERRELTSGVPPRGHAAASVRS